MCVCWCHGVMVVAVVVAVVVVTVLVNVVVVIAVVGQRWAQGPFLGDFNSTNNIT